MPFHRSLVLAAGRLKRLSEITYDVKHLIILDDRHRLVQHLHEMHYHTGVDFMRAQVQQRYAVLKFRNIQQRLKIPVWCVVVERPRRYRV